MLFSPLLLGSDQGGTFILFPTIHLLLLMQFWGKKSGQYFLWHLFVMILLGKQYNNEVALLQNKQHNSPPIIW